jgi:Tol biopolymer transport system component
MTRLLGATVVLSLLTSGARAQELAPNENLVLDGVPKIPLALADAVGRYADFRSASFQSWHPTRREMLIRTRFGDTAQAHWVKAPGGDRRQMTFFREAVGAASFPRRSDAYFVFTKDKGGDEFSQIFRYDVRTGDVTLLTDGGRSQNGLGPFSHAGDLLAYASTRRNGADRNIYVMDPKDPRTARLVLEAKGGGWVVVDWSIDDKTLLVEEFVSVNESYLYLVDVANGARQALTPKTEGEVVSYGTAAFAPDGKTVYAVHLHLLSHPHCSIPPP